jgi:hypothetical protein
VRPGSLRAGEVWVGDAATLTPREVLLARVEFCFDPTELKTEISGSRLAILYAS